MPKGGAKSGEPCHIYLDKEQAVMLDAIGAAMGRRRLGVKAHRSQLISTAIRNFIVDCRDEEDLMVAIEDARRAFDERENKAQNTRLDVNE